MNKINIEEVKKLYEIEKCSASQIAERLGCSMWSVYKLMERNNITRRTGHESNRYRYEASPLSFLPQSNLNEQEKILKQSALMLYWAEGSKRDRKTVDFANSDPEMVDIFIQCLRQIYRVSENRFRVLLYCYANQSIEDLLAFWSGVTQIPLSQFTKPYVRQDFSLKHHAMPYGLVHIRYSDQRLFQFIMADIRKCIDSCRVGGVDNHC